MRKVLTLCLIQRPGEVLLGMKKRGFGVGRWNGFGGKVEPGESIEDAVRREVWEEAGIEVIDVVEVGTLDFIFESKPDDVLEVHVYRSEEFLGRPVETEEMRPQWFADCDIPFAEMWPDDIHWFPHFLAGKRFTGMFYFGDGDRILEQKLVLLDDQSRA